MEKVILFPLLLGLTLVGYILGVWVRRITRRVWLNPLITGSIFIIAVIMIFGIPFEMYEKANTPMRFLMDLSVVSLGWLLYDRMDELKKTILPIIVSSVVGAIVAMLSVSAVFLLFDAPKDLVVSVIPKSITAPIAIRLSQSYGGLESITAVAVFLTGVFGAFAAPFFLGKIGVDSPVAKGLAIGCSSHAIGTSRAIELGAVEGALSGLAIGIMGACTAVLYPLYVLIFY